MKEDYGGKHKKTSIISLIILIIVLLFSYLQFDDYSSNIEVYKDIYDSTEIEESNYIKTIFYEETKLSKKSMNIIVERIQDQLVLKYGKNLDNLDEDIDNPRSDSELTKVFDDTLGDFYINENTNVNKPFVLSMNSLLWGRCLSYDNAENEFLTIDDLLSLQNNNKLNKEAIFTILKNDNTKYIFWQNNGDTKLEYMNIDKLIEIYSNEGLNSMKNYELLVPVYITKDGDIFGTKDTDGLGHKIDNYKIIIVQRMNVYDILKQYSSELSTYESEKQRIIDRKIINMNDKTRSLLISGSMVLIVLFGSAYLQNKKYE